MAKSKNCPSGCITALLEHRLLITQFVKRSVLERYRGSFLGVFWSLITPLLMLGVYSFVFTIVFKARWGVETGAKGEFAIILFSGLILHSFFTDILNRAPTIIVENINFVKKVIFPLEVFAPIISFTALFQLLISSIVLVAGIYFVYGAIPVTILYAPIIILPLFVLAIGLAWMLAAIGVYIRDIAQFMGIISTLLLFLSTIFYPASILPPIMQKIIYLNPLSFIVEQLRAVVITGGAPDWYWLGVYSSVSAVIFVLGYVLFQKMRKGFADVI